ncbi:MAG TPA: glycosyl hydrolase [bacterium]|nr:glycosyl hydrolase [bacterium]
MTHFANQSASLLLAASALLPAQTTDRDHLRDNVLAQLRWRELGPVQSGGRIVDIAVHPDRSREFWLAAASGGIWHTDNGGLTFEPQFQDQYSISIGDICIAPSDPRVLYVGTGEANNQRSSYWGNGVYRSDDGGKTFRHLGLDGTDHIGRIVVHPEDPDTVYVAALGPLYRPGGERGLYKTTDGGRSWRRIHYIDADTGFVDVALHPHKPNIVFAASYQRRRRAWNFAEGGEGSRLWRSLDAGANWQRLDHGLPEGELGRIGIAPFAGDGNTVYVCIENLNPRVRSKQPTTTQDEDDPRDRDRRAQPSAEVLADPVARALWAAGPEAAQDPERRPRRRLVGGEVYRSDDAGDTFYKTHETGSIGGMPGYYYGQIRVDPNDRDTVYVLSVPVYKSTDGGKTWTPGRGRKAGGSAFASRLHVDHHALWIDPRDSDHCLLGNDGGIAQTFDQGATWDHLTHLPILQFYAIGVDDRTPYHVYGGLQDNGTWRFPIHGPTSAGIEALDAVRIGGGDGFHVVVDPSDSDIVYSESQFGGMSRQNLRTGERKSIRPQAQKGEPPLRFNWMTPIVLSPHSPHTVYTGSQFLHRSRDRGDHWQRISPDLTTNDPDKLRGDVPHCTITTIAESPHRQDLLWVGTDDGRVWCSRDGGGRWSERTDRFPRDVQGLWVSRIEASPHDADTAFVSFTGYREDIRTAYVFRTDDGGETFLSISHDLPAEPVNVVRQHPRNASVLLVGTEMGCYVSIDDGAHWHPLGHGLPRVAVHDLLVHPRHAHVLVGTHGRGVFALDAAALERLTPNAVRSPLLVLPPSDGVLLRSRIDRGYTGARGWRVPNPFTAPTFHYVLAHDSDEPVKVEVLDATGAVLWRHDGPGEAGYHEVVWSNPRRRGRFGAFGGQRNRGSRGPRPGTFAVRISLGGNAETQAFTVHDRRQASPVLGSNPAGAERDAGQRRP